MPIFETQVQELKFKALLEVAKLAYEDDLDPARLMDIPAKVIKDGPPTLRCCIYKERAIIGERVKLALGGDRENPHVVEVLPIACDECPVDGISVSPACRGCIAHRCMQACPKDAISITPDHKAHIDKSKCIECGRCLAACPYSAIVRNTRPCVNACKAKALSIDPETQKAVISYDKCIDCGACVYQCPFGAISDKSFITEAIRLLVESHNNTRYSVYAIVAPSVASQYGYTYTEQVVAGIKALGFHAVVEAAWGADLAAWHESRELQEKGFLLSSCCPAFVEYTKKNYPRLEGDISHNLSPMALIAKVLKRQDPTCKTVFIGPCIAKKGEALREEVAKYIDCVLTFEEMQALFVARDVSLADLPVVPLDNASPYGRMFARTGGLAGAVQQALSERGVTEEEFKLSAVSCDGLEECKKALAKANAGHRGNNFIEGMACVHGCIGGPACLSHSLKDKALVDEYAHLALEKDIQSAIAVLDMK